MVLNPPSPTKKKHSTFVECFFLVLGIFNVDSESRVYRTPLVCVLLW